MQLARRLSLASGECALVSDWPVIHHIEIVSCYFKSSSCWQRGLRLSKSLHLDPSEPLICTDMPYTGLATLTSRYMPRCCASMQGKVFHEVELQDEPSRLTLGRNTWSLNMKTFLNTNGQEPIHCQFDEFTIYP